VTLEIPSFIFLRVIWDAHHVKVPLARIFGSSMKELHVAPEPGHPFGRKGLALASAWKTLARPDTAGMLLLDGDVLIDPHDYLMMLSSLVTEPDAIHIGPAKLWPVTMGDAPGWVWGHCRNAEWSQEMTENPDFTAFNFTYVPRRVWELAIGKGLKGWVFPEVDRGVSRVAREAKVPMRVVKDCHPKHMHY
jgi:hypothetical protein